jgi:uncharacterized protein with HEPN domain
MKAERKYIDFLQDIVNNLEKAESFTRGWSSKTSRRMRKLAIP